MRSATNGASQPPDDEPAHEGSNRREEQQDAQAVADEAGQQQQRARAHDQPAVDELTARHRTRVQLPLRPAPHADALALHEPGAGDAHDHHQQERLDHPDGLADLDDDRQLDDRHEDEKHDQQGQHGVHRTAACRLFGLGTR